jgi:pimeloyl-ACP methyl ester carboxylesterase
MEINGGMIEIKCYFRFMNITYHAVLSGHQKIAYSKSSIHQGIPPLVLLHGFCEDSSLWDEWLPAAPGLSVIRIDLPGFGQSDLSEVPGMDAYAQAVKAVLDQEAIIKCVLVGHSMGGYTALAFAAFFPEYLCGLGLFHAHPLEDTPEQKENRNRGIEMIWAGKKDLYVAQLFPKLFEDTFEKQQPEVVLRLIRKGQEQSAEGIIHALESMKARPNRTNVLVEATFPVLFLLGKNDVLIPYLKVLGIAAMMRETEVQLPERVAHMGMFESVEATSNIVKRFWQRSIQKYLF